MKIEHKRRRPRHKTGWKRFAMLFVVRYQQHIPPDAHERQRKKLISGIHQQKPAEPWVLLGVKAEGQRRGSELLGRFHQNIQQRAIALRSRDALLHRVLMVPRLSLH